MAWLMGGCVVRYVGECFRACGRMACYFVCLSGNDCFYSPLQSRLALAYFGSATRGPDFSTNRMRYWSNLVIEAARTHLTIVFNDQQQQGAQQK